MRMSSSLYPSFLLLIIRLPFFHLFFRFEIWNTYVISWNKFYALTISYFFYLP